MTGRVLLGLLIGLVLMGLAAWGAPLEEVGSAIAGVDPASLAFVAFAFLVQQALRALRQRLLVRAVAPSSTWDTNHAVLCMSFLCVNSFPARLGELVRPVLLQRKEGIAFSTGLSLVLVERLFDLGAVFVVLEAVLWAAPVGEAAGPAQRAALALLLPALAGAVGLLAFGPRLVGWLGTWAPARLVGALEGFVQGLRLVGGGGPLAAGAALTGVIWAWTGLYYVVLARALGLGHLVGYVQGMGVLVLTMLGSALPAPPGFAGVYEASCRGALALFGVVGEGLDARALAFALVIHWWTWLVQALSALYYFRREGEGFWELGREALSIARGSRS